MDGIAVITFLHYMLDWKSTTNASDTSADMILRLISKVLLNFTNNVPQTWHQVKSMLNPEDATTYKYERCICQEHFFYPIPKEV